MRVLLDTNLLIGREDPANLSNELADLLEILSRHRIPAVIHPATLAEVGGDQNLDRRERTLSKLRAYPLLEEPPLASTEFIKLCGGAGSSHDLVDITLLQAVGSNAVSFLVTEDQGLVRRSSRAGLSDRVLRTAAALAYFRQFLERTYPEGVPFVRRVPVHRLNPKDHFFDSFRTDYPGFDNWMAKIAAEGRACYRSELSNGRLGSLLIFKDDDRDPVCGQPSASRLKICSLKVSEEQAGFRLGESLLQLALRYGYQNRVRECYVTVFPKYGELVSLLSTFGFQTLCSLPNGEEVLMKQLEPPREAHSLEPVEFLRRYFPAFREDSAIRKFLVPIRPEYHKLLFPEYGTAGIQRTLDGHRSLPPPAGNAIRKAYLCNSKATQVRPGDVLLFYRSGDVQAITHRGVVEQVRRCATPEQVVDFVGNRTVLPRAKLEQMCINPLLGILFWNVGKLPAEVPLSALEREGLGWPQSLVRVNHDGYLRLLEQPHGGQSSLRSSPGLPS